MTVKGDTQAAVDFLKLWEPTGPWALTAVIPDGTTDTRLFVADQSEEMHQWIDKLQGQKNIYFHVNPVKSNLTVKASKEDVLRLGWLHVDLDPRPGEDFEDERSRALKLLQKYDPKPSVIVDSGGGFQGFWKLEPSEKLEINGVVEKAQELEAYNIQLEKEFQADHCHNVDRIMRLPGTINLPTKKKTKKGRVPTLAKLVEWNDVAYPIEKFVAAVRVQMRGETGLTGGRPKIKITGSPEDIGVEELRAWAEENNVTITDHTYALIATGQDPIDTTKYPSRSEALFRVCCDLVRAKVPDEKIFSIITGSNEIAASVKDKPNSDAYALRQIERAHEDAINPMLRRLNEKHAVISDICGKCRIISEVHDTTMNRTRVSKQSFEDFRNRYRNQMVVVGHNEKGQEITKPAGSFWIDHPNRRQYETIVFAPGREIDDVYNLWQGFACDSLSGDKHKTFLEHIRENICSDNEDHYNYLIGWLARLIQEPDSPGEVAVVLRGKRGTGKSFFAKVVGAILGRHYLQVSDSKHLVGSFNAHLRDTVLLFGDEAFFAGDKKHESVLKTLITEEHLVIEGKGIDAEPAPNYVHLILASNEDWVVPAGLDERRFLVLEVSDSQKQNHNYFKRIRNDLDNGGLENLLHFLLTYDLNEYEVRTVPQTKALQEQKIMSMAPEAQWFFDKLIDGRMLKHEQEWPERVLKDDLYQDYVDDLRDQGRNYRMSRINFGKFIQHALPGNWPLIKQEWAEIPTPNEHGYEILVKKRAYFFYLPRLDDVRAYWDEAFGGPFDWTTVIRPKDMIQKKATKVPY